MVTGAILYTFVVGIISPQASLFAGGFLPFAASGLADMLGHMDEEVADSVEHTKRTIGSRKIA